jgi:hypothetical protein
VHDRVVWQLCGGRGKRSACSDHNFLVVFFLGWMAVSVQLSPSASYYWSGRDSHGNSMDAVTCACGPCPHSLAPGIDGVNVAFAVCDAVTIMKKSHQLVVGAKCRPSVGATPVGRLASREIDFPIKNATRLSGRGLCGAIRGLGAVSTWRGW